MCFKRGMIIGILLFLTGLEYLFESFNLFYCITFILGMIQIAVSINYRKGCKKHILLFCFIIEDIYYCGAMIYLIISSNFFWRKCFRNCSSVGVLRNNWYSNV